jgi:hypothetical protein
VAQYAKAASAKAAGYAKSAATRKGTSYKRETTAYYMVRVNIEGVLTTVQAHRGWRSLSDSYGQFKGVSAALIEAEREDGYTENHNVLNIVSSKYHDLPRGFDDYAGCADHINSNPDLNTLYSTALDQCKELGKKTELKELGNQRMGYGLILLQCNEFLPGSQLSTACIRINLQR